MPALAKDVKAAFSKIWSDPTYRIVAIVVVGVIIYFLYQRYRSQQAASQAPATHGTPSGYTIINEYYQGVPTTTPTPPGTNPPEKPPHPAPHCTPCCNGTCAPPGSLCPAICFPVPATQCGPGLIIGSDGQCHPLNLSVVNTPSSNNPYQNTTIPPSQITALPCPPGYVRSTGCRVPPCGCQRA